MECIKTVKFKIKVSDKSFNDTIAIYNEALSYIISIINDEWNTISTLATVEKQLNFIEKLIHNTKEKQIKVRF